MYKRNKYNYEFRLRCVKAVLKGKQSVSSIARGKGVDRANLRLWLVFYEKYGIAGLKPRGKQHYDAGFKRQVLETLDKELLSLRSACLFR